MQSRVAFDGKRQVGAEWRGRLLVGSDLGLGGQRKALEIVPGVHRVQALPIEPIRFQEVADTGAQPLELRHADVLYGHRSGGLGS